MEDMEELSIAQKRWWVDYQRCPNAKTNYAQVCYKISGTLDLTQFKQAVFKVLNSYDLFKTEFIQSDNCLYKKVIVTHLPKLEVQRIPNSNPLEKGSVRVEDVIADILSKPIDFLSYPNYQLKLIEASESAYYFLVSMPHILIDGISADVLLRDIAECYNNSTLKYIPKNQFSFKNNECHKINSDYWLEKIESSVSELSFSQKNIRSRQSDSKNKRCYLNLVSSSVVVLKKIASQYKTTPFLSLFSLLSIALYKYSHQKKFSILYTVNTRGPKQNTFLGSFVNLIPMAINLSPDHLFSDCIKQITLQRKKDKLHQNIPYRNILSALRSKQSGSTLYNLLFSNTRFLPTNFKLHGLKVEFFPFDLEKDSLFDLSFLYDSDDKNMVIALDYNQNKYDTWFIDQFLLYLKSLIERTCVLENLALCDVPYFFEENSGSVQRNYALESPVLPLQFIFKRSVQRNPKHIALSDGSRYWTYEEMNCLSNQWAACLHSMGIKAHTRVMLLLEREPSTIILILALLKLRCAYVPLEKRFPDASIKEVLLDASIEYVIGDDATKKALLAEMNVKWILFKDIEKQSAVDQSDVYWSEAKLEDLVYILYSSGTTGKPKGIPIKQRNLAHLLSDKTMSLFNFNSSDVWSISHSLAFDFSVWEIWGAFSQGATALIVPASILLSPVKFYDFILQKGVTILNQTPSYFKKLMTIDQKNKKYLSLLRTIIFGAEKLFPVDLAAWVNKYGLKKPVLINMYGLTEATIHATFHRIQSEDLHCFSSPIGKPLPYVRGYLMNVNNQHVPPGVKGEICLIGPNITSGYLNRDDLNKKQFIPCLSNRDENIYCTGDMAQSTPDGQWTYIGRRDDQVKLQGYRVELHKVEEAIRQIDGIRDAIVIVCDVKSDSHLIAFYCHDECLSIDASFLLRSLKKILPRYMVPVDALPISDIPMTLQGKIDYQSLNDFYHLNRDQVLKSQESLVGDITDKIIFLWKKILMTSSQLPLDQPFFEAGGDSVDLLELHVGLEKIIQRSIPFEVLFENTTIQEQSDYLSLLHNKDNMISASEPCAILHSKTKSSSTEEQSIAIIGMACRFPGANDTNDFWKNLCEGKESITFFEKEVLRESGISNKSLQSPNYIRAKGFLADADQFDADFFNITATEALLLDPQQRCFLEICWNALEDAGYVTENQAGKVGVFSGGSSIRNYYQTYLLKDEKLQEQCGEYAIYLNNALDFLSARTSFKLNLTGPSITLQTGCSTSLVAVCYAVRSLLNHECNMAIAGGVSLTMPLRSGYPYQEGMILSPDGHCRAFDIAANGTVPGNGVGVVVLKRLSNAIADGDVIDAVICGHTVNNDGGHKLGMTTPSESSQIDLIRSALQAAGCEPDEIDYIEAHGTGTVQGDRIELSAINKVFSTSNHRERPCYLGSVKTNIGHLDTASGIAGLIKTALCLKHKKWVPSLHFNKPNSIIDFKQVPLEVLKKVKNWRESDKVQKAAITSLAVGGTNAHLILSQYKLLEEKKPIEKAGEVALILSAKNSFSLKSQCKQLCHFLLQDKHCLAHIAYTLQVGRKHFSHRVAVTGNDKSMLADSLHKLSELQSLDSQSRKSNVAFLFSDQGEDVKESCKLFYNHYPLFKEYVDQCCQIVEAEWHYDLYAYLFSSGISKRSEQESLVLYHVSLFVFQYAMAQQWIAWGVVPGALIGCGLGEYISACVSNVWSFEHAVRVIAKRSALISQTDVGATIVVSIDFCLLDKQLKVFSSLSLAATHDEDQYIISGPQDGMRAFISWLSQNGIAYRYLSNRYAYHSKLMQTISELFQNYIAQYPLNMPSIPFMSSLTGRWAIKDSLRAPSYWAEQLYHPIQFSKGLKTICRDIENVSFLSMSMQLSFNSLIRKHSKKSIVFSLSNRKTGKKNSVFNIESILARLWEKGISVDWPMYHKDNNALKRVHLPTYPFNRKTFWPDVLASVDKKEVERETPSQWCYRPVWQYQPITSIDEDRYILVLFCDDSMISDQLSSEFSEQSESTYLVYRSNRYSMTLDREIYVNPDRKEDYNSLFKILKQQDNRNFRFIYLWSLTKSNHKRSEKRLNQDFLRFILFIQSVQLHFNADYNIDISVIANNLWKIAQNDYVDVNQHMLLGPALTINQESSYIHCRVIDLSLYFKSKDCFQDIIEFLKYDISQQKECLVAYRHGQRLVRSFEPLSSSKEKALPVIRKSGVYLITGGLGEIGLTFAEYLSSQENIKLVLLQRSQLIDRSVWNDKSVLGKLNKQQLLVLNRLKKIENLGSKVYLFQCDINRRQQLLSALNKIEKEIGCVCGVIHAAGSSSGRLIQNVNLKELNISYDAKIKGTRVLHDVFSHYSLDFMIFCSALSTVLGYPGQSVYNAANAFLDAFAKWRTLNCRRTIAINWDTWKSGGMAVKGLQALPEYFSSAILDAGMHSEEAKSVMHRILSLSDSQVIVSKRDLDQNFLKQLTAHHNERAKKQVIPDKRLEREIISKNVEDIKAHVKAAWCACLGQDSVTEDSDFFELGGDSLTAIQMVALIEKKLNLKLNAHDILESSSFSDFTESIISRLKNISLRNKQSPLVCLKKGTCDINLFLIHPIGGTIYVYRDMSLSFNSDISVYGIQNTALLNENIPRENVVDMAKEYVEVIRHKQSHGPYYLGGSSFGGLLAYEMAQQLACLGAEVPIVILLDTPGFQKMPKYLIKDADILSYMLQVGEQKQFDRSKFYAMTLDEQIGFFIKDVKHLLHADATTKEDIKYYLTLYKANMKALFDYRPNACSEKVKKIYYFSARDRDPINPLRPEEGWKCFLKKKCITFKVAGNHITMLFPPNVNSITSRLDQFFIKSFHEERI